jgi:Single-strand binding protein family
MSRYIEYLLKVGRVSRDPELKYRPDGQAVANFSVTSHVGRVRFGSARVTGNQDAKTFEVNQDISYEITVVGKLAEICAKHITKGQKIYIRGRRLTRRNADGEREDVIFAEGIHFAGAPPEVESDDDAGRDVTRWIPHNEVRPALWE